MCVGHSNHFGISPTWAAADDGSTAFYVPGELVMTGFCRGRKRTVSVAGGGCGGVTLSTTYLPGGIPATNLVALQRHWLFLMHTISDLLLSRPCSDGDV